MLDAAVFSARLLDTLTRVSLDRLRPRPGSDGPIPSRVEQVDPAWLSTALAPHFPGVRVEAATRLGGHSGTTTRERIQLRYAASGPGSQGAAPPPPTVFVKLAPAGLATRLFTTLMDLGVNEVGFYRDVRPDLPVRAPHVWCARSAPRGGRFVLLLEDLVAAGCRFPSFHDAIDVELARSVVLALARLHARFWESPRFEGDLTWLKCPERNRNARVERFLSLRANAPALARFGDLVPPAVRAGSPRIHARREALERFWARAPRTLIHGDTHLGNLFLDGDEVGLLDWQVLQQGPGVRDVGYFLVTSLPVDLRRAYERELVAVYRAALLREGVAAPDAEALWRVYRSIPLYVWFSATVTAAAGRLQPEAVSRLAMERAGAAVEDHASLALLEELG